LLAGVAGGLDLARVLDGCGHGEYKTGGVMHVSWQRILDAIADRAADAVEDDEDDA
jgi:S-DNA-T family DNA segregation ATPase FtsK/SpoIIIE